MVGRFERRDYTFFIHENSHVCNPGPFFYSRMIHAFRLLSSFRKLSSRLETPATITTTTSFPAPCHHPLAYRDITTLTTLIKTPSLLLYLTTRRS